MNDKQPGLFDFIKDLSYDKNYIFDDYSPGDFNAFMVNRGFSYYPDTILFASEMNKYPNLERKAQNDFYFYGLDKRKRFSKWFKPGKDESLDMIQERYQCNIERAKEYLTLFSPEDLKDLKKSLDKGGLQRGRKKK